MQRHVYDLPPGHLDVGDVLVKERFEDDHFIALFDERHEGTQHALIGSSGDGDLGLVVQRTTPVRSVRISDGLLQSRPPLGEGVLVAFDPVQCILCSIQDELGWVVAEEALAQVDNGLVGGGYRRLVDNGPATVNMII